MFCNWNESSLNPLMRIKWRASLVPAAAVIPAPLAYIKIVAVKTFEVDYCPVRVLHHQVNDC